MVRWLGPSRRPQPFRSGMALLIAAVGRALFLPAAVHALETGDITRPIISARGLDYRYLMPDDQRIAI